MDNDTQRFGPATDSKPRGPVKPSAPAPPPARPTRPPAFQVEEIKTRRIQVGHSTVTFRPNEIIRDPYKVALAQENDIALREK